MRHKRKTILDLARTCFAIEIEALRATAEHLDDTFVDTIGAIEEAILSGGKLIFTGVGKNVPVCHKLASTFNSTGVPATVLDPNQALHGDLGLCARGDLAFLFSNSGETEDLLRIVPFLKRLEVGTVAITAAPASSLAQVCDRTLCYRIEREACPLNLAPTASTTAALALGDALAMVYLDLRGFTKEDFARYHPAGSLGKMLLLRISEIMKTGDNFAVGPSTLSVQEALLRITQARCGTIALVDPETGTLAGVFTDGDFRRAALRDDQILKREVSTVMTRSPRTVRAADLVVEALKVFERANVNDLIAVDGEGRPLGLVDGQDIPRLRIV